MPPCSGQLSCHSEMEKLQYTQDSHAFSERLKNPLQEETGIRWRKQESSNSGVLAEQTAQEVHPFNLCQDSCHAIVSEARDCRESPLWIALPESSRAGMNGWGNAGDPLQPSTSVLRFPKDLLLTVALWEASTRGLRVQSAGHRNWLSAHRRWFYFFQITKSLKASDLTILNQTNKTYCIKLCITYLGKWALEWLILLLVEWHHTN